MATMTNSEDRYTKISHDKHKIPEVDAYNNIIICKINNILLQKWNNIIINYNGGTLDIFYNGELVKSQPEIVPYMTNDELIVGKNNGLNGGIRNVIYFNKNLDITQIYNLVKDNKFL
jgi:hypothetical protein